MASSDFQVTGKNAKALFTLKLHRGDGMCLVAMNWKTGRPPDNFVGFAIESKPPGGDTFFPLNNRLTFAASDGEDNPVRLSTLVSPIQKFRWVHFPRNANLDGAFTYRVTPIFMDEDDRLSQGEPQEADIELRRETYPGQVNVTFTRGFVSSQAFVDKFEKFGDIKTLLPATAKAGLKFKATHPRKDEALAWMGFEARETILELLDQAIKEKADVRVVAYDLSEPEVVGRLEKLKKKLRIIIDDSKEHGAAESGETQAATAPQENRRRGQREAPAYEEPSAQQDDHRQRQEDEEGRVRVNQPELAWSVRSGQQRVRGGRKEGRRPGPRRVRQLLRQ